jgi:CheY-like chemotaxis protein
MDKLTKRLLSAPRDLLRAGPTEAAKDDLSWRLRILVVDDDEGCLTSVEALLSLDGHSILTARRGREAVDFARQMRKRNEGLDLSILDFNMPDWTGIETFERLSLEFPGLKAVFMSGDPSEGLEAAVRRAGGRALVKKPLDLYRVRKVLGRLKEGDGFLVT